jgi:DtxR family Mn-dependent transcriptional regulator
MSDAAPILQRSETSERYLEAIYYIQHEGEVPRPGRLAEWLGVSAPTVTVSLQRLARDGLVSIAGDRSVELTEKGAEAAATIVRRHRIVERWLTDVLGLDWASTGWTISSAGRARARMATSSPAGRRRRVGV